MRRLLKRMVLGLFVAGAVTTSTLPNARADWAIAFSQTGEKGWAFGTSVKPNDKAAARKAALANCRSKGSGCKIISDGEGDCVALAVGLTDNAWAVEPRETRLEAGKRALKECASVSDGDCEVKKTFCDK